EDINNKRKIVKLGESALRVRPFQLIYDNTLKDIGLTEISLDGYKEKIEKLSIKKEEAEKSFEMATDRKHNELPKLKVKEQMVKDAIEEKRIIYGLNKEIIEIGDKISECELKKENKAKKLYNIKDNIIKMNSDIKSLEKNSEELKIDNGVKEKVQRGVLVSEKYNSIYSVVETSKNKIKILEKEINKEEEKAATINSNLIEKIGKLKVSENIMEDLVENSPGESEKLLDMQKILSNAKESWNKYTEYQEEIKKSNLSLMDYTGKLEENKKLKIDIEFNLEKFKSQAKERETENLAHKLRQALNNGDICPVCGSKEHHIENIKSIENIEDEELKELENKIENFEKQLKRIEENITKYKTNTSIIENKIKEYMLKIESLGEDFKKISITELEETFNAFQKSLNDYNKNKKELTVLIEETKEEKGKLEVEINTCTTTIRNKKNQLEQLKIENEKDIENLSNVQKQFNDLKDETGIEDFVKRNREILAAENEIEIILNKVKTNRNILEQLNNDSKSVEENIVEIKSELDRQKIFLEDKNKTIQEKSEIIKMKIGHLENLSEDLDNIEKTIKDIEEKFIEGEKLKQNIYEAYQECNDKLVKTSGKINELYKRRNTEKEELDSNMKNEGFQSVDEINENLISRIEMDKLNIIIDKYNEDLSKIIAVIESVSKKIGNRTLEDEQWKKIQEEKEEKEIQLKNLNEIKIKLEEEVKIIKTKLLELKELLAKKAIIDYKLALLSDLEKLFKGKKFVEFVAATRLKHISAEASVRLKEITNGIYGLKVDENGKFIIRDYKNGGAERDASTLSGGETFLASLSLALALSTEIQLKGTAPLELFFLDEGFGTLDDDLLDVVLSSLEKIHNEKLKVGIISHVESIKNRIPVKLVITPAEAGKGGSKIGTVQ
ncbi:MAG: SbcC/MukB-like Walker B domain-containing protein, partial [Clostridiaceae bacterium]